MSFLKKFSMLKQTKIFLLIRVVAVDLRGYNLSERPEGLEHYKLQEIIEDLRALIEQFSKIIFLKYRLVMQISMTRVFVSMFFHFVFKHEFKTSYLFIVNDCRYDFVMHVYLRNYSA